MGDAENVPYGAFSKGPWPWGRLERYTRHEQPTLLFGELATLKTGICAYAKGVVGFKCILK
jgi:hypothetical protein